MSGDHNMRGEEPMDNLPTYSECNQSDNKTLEYSKYAVRNPNITWHAITPQGVPIKFKPTGFRAENEGSISVDISVDPENEIGCPQYLLIEQDDSSICVTKDCLYQLYLAACELQK